MLVRVKCSFIDKFSSKLYTVGEALEFEDSRALDCIERGLVESIEEPKKKKTTRKK